MKVTWQKIVSLLSISILCITSCDFKTDKETTLTGTWRLYDVEQLSPPSKTDDSFAADARLKEMVKDGTILCFFEDGSYAEIKDKGEYKTGAWKFFEQKKTISFIDAGQPGTPVPAVIENKSTGKQQLTISLPEKNIAMKFVKESEAMKLPAEDPFYATNNKWRVKPLKPENAEQLTERLTNYFKHLALILKAARERKENIVSFGFSMGPVKIYNGGIGIYPYNIVPETWKNTFYNEDDAAKAYSKYQQYLQTNSYKGAGIGEWMEDDYNILLSIYTGLKSADAGNIP